MVARSVDPTSSDVAAHAREPSKIEIARERYEQGGYIVPWPPPPNWHDELVRRYDAGERISNEPLPDRIQPKRSGHCAICDAKHVFIAIMRNDNPDIARAILCSPECYQRWVEQNDPSC